MTRKDYELIADAIKQHSAAANPDAAAAVRRVAHELTEALSADNSRFDTSRFLKACGVEE